MENCVKSIIISDYGSDCRAAAGWRPTENAILEIEDYYSVHRLGQDVSNVPKFAVHRQGRLYYFSLIVLLIKPKLKARTGLGRGF